MTTDSPATRESVEKELLNEFRHYGEFTRVYGGTIWAALVDARLALREHWGYIYPRNGKLAQPMPEAGEIGQAVGIECEETTNLAATTTPGTESDKEKRVRRSLDALNSPSPTNLSTKEWKEVMNDAEGFPPDTPCSVCGQPMPWKAECVNVKCAGREGGDAPTGGRTLEELWEPQLCGHPQMLVYATPGVPGGLNCALCELAAERKKQAALREQLDAATAKIQRESEEESAIIERRNLENSAIRKHAESLAAEIRRLREALEEVRQYAFVSNGECDWNHPPTFKKIEKLCVAALAPSPGAPDTQEKK